MFRPHWVCPAHGCLCFPRLHCSAALYGAGPALSAAPVFRSSTKARILLRLRVVSSPRLSGSGSQRLAGLFPPRRVAQAARCLAHSPQVRRSFSLRGPSAHRRSGLRKSLYRNRGLFAVWDGVASLGLSLPLSPPRCLLPPAGMGRFFSGVSQSLCFANRRQCVPAS